MLRAFFMRWHSRAPSPWGEGWGEGFEAVNGSSSQVGLGCAESVTFAFNGWPLFQGGASPLTLALSPRRGNKRKRVVWRCNDACICSGLAFLETHVASRCCPPQPRTRLPLPAGGCLKRVSKSAGTFRRDAINGQNSPNHSGSPRVSLNAGTHFTT